MKLFKKLTGVDTNEIVKDGKDIIGMTSNKAQGTQRHKQDMLSDNRLSKNIRPLIIIWILSLFTIMMGCIIIFDTDFPQTIMNTLFVILGASITFYFPGRSIEKYFKSKIK